MCLLAQGMVEAGAAGGGGGAGGAEGAELGKEGEGADSLASPARQAASAARCALCCAPLTLAPGTPKLMECLHSACEPCITAKVDEKQASGRDFLGTPRRHPFFGAMPVQRDV